MAACRAAFLEKALVARHSSAGSPGERARPPPCLGKRGFYDTDRRRAGQGAEPGKGVQLTRLRNLCRGYSMMRQKNGTWRRPGFPTALQSDNGPPGLHRPITRNVSTLGRRGRAGSGKSSLC